MVTFINPVTVKGSILALRHSRRVELDPDQIATLIAALERIVA